MTRFRLARLLGSLLLLIPVCVFAKDNPEQTQFSRDIRVDSGQSVGDITCLNCSIYIAGKSNGEATAIHGNVIMEPGGSVGGDVTAIWGDVRLHPGSQIGGDATAVAGAVRRDPQSTIGGDVTSLEGAKWLLAMILPPLFILGLIVALIIWLVQRSRRPAQVPQTTFAPQR